LARLLLPIRVCVLIIGLLLFVLVFVVSLPFTGATRDKLRKLAIKTLAQSFREEPRARVPACSISCVCSMGYGSYARCDAAAPHPFGADLA